MRAATFLALTGFITLVGCTPATPGDQYGNNRPQMCGGIAGIACPQDYSCVDDTTDDCDPAKGGADCSGVCVKN